MNLQRRVCPFAGNQIGLDRQRLLALESNMKLIFAAFTQLGSQHFIALARGHHVAAEMAGFQGRQNTYR